MSKEVILPHQEAENDLSHTDTTLAHTNLGTIKMGQFQLQELAGCGSQSLMGLGTVLYSSTLLPSSLLPSPTPVLPSGTGAFKLRIANQFSA